MRLEELVKKLDQEFEVKAYGADPAFKRFLPAAYESVSFDWEAAFEEEFTSYFNGLMIRGASEVEQVFLAVFPTDHVLERFIKEGKPGDLLFMHHPLLMECGDPQGKWGRGFIPIQPGLLEQLKEKQLSVYTCHIPLDYHPTLGTSAAMAASLGMTVTDGFLANDRGEHLILIGEIDEIDSPELKETLQSVFSIPYVDCEGPSREKIRKIAVVAGCGDKVEWMEEVEKKGVQAYITGEIHCHIDSEYGRGRFSKMMAYASGTGMSLIGVSHAASEYLVKKTLMKDWFEQNMGLNTTLLPQEKWWL
ncbi:Nif3-like dinuclear metal center hexameric protein [Rossellomorea marisflavi]|uniref:Nif3-like dinuclear metal center hexameric protein n=1 Tax=Rossellomorea marisflavi TaxID=189381 RepID=UPI00345CB9EE